MTTWLWWRTLAEYLGGERDVHPLAVSCPLASLHSPWWGLWWAFLACLVFVFCGQSSKFIYIDF